MPHPTLQQVNRSLEQVARVQGRYTDGCFCCRTTHYKLRPTAHARRRFPLADHDMAQRDVSNGSASPAPHATRAVSAEQPSKSKSAKPTPIKALPGSAVLKASNTYLLKNKVFRLREDCMPPWSSLTPLLTCS